MTKHTPGPWKVEGNSVFALNDEHNPANRFYAHVEKGWIYRAERPTDDEIEANGRLIAAAPELLAALQGALTMWDRLYPIMPADMPFEDAEFQEMQHVRAAIAKATGEA